MARRKSSSKSASGSVPDATKPKYKHPLARAVLRLLDQLLVAIGPFTLIVLMREKGGTATWAPNSASPLVDLAAVGAMILGLLWSRSQLDRLRLERIEQQSTPKSLRGLFRQIRGDAAKSSAERFRLARPRFVVALFALVPFMVAHASLVVPFHPAPEKFASIETLNDGSPVPFNICLSELEDGTLQGRVLLPLWATERVRLLAAEEHQSKRGFFRAALEGGDASEAIDRLRDKETKGVIASSVLLVLLYLAVIHFGTAVYGLLSSPTLSVFESSAEFFGWLE